MNSYQLIKYKFKEKLGACVNWIERLATDQEVLGSNPNEAHHNMEKVKSISIIFPLYKDKSTVKK